MNLNLATKILGFRLKNRSPNKASSMALGPIITKKIGFGNLESPKLAKKARQEMSGFPLKQFDR